MYGFRSALALGLAVAGMSAEASAQIQPNSQFVSVREFFIPDAEGGWEEFRAAGFAQPQATGVNPQLWLMPRMEVRRDAIKFYDERGLPFTPNEYSGEVAVSITVPIQFDPSLPDQRERVGVGAALGGQSLKRWGTHWLVAPNVDLPYVHGPLSGNPMVTQGVIAAYHQIKPFYDQIAAAGKVYDGYQAIAATLNQLRVTVLVDGEKVASRDYSGSMVNFGDTIPALTIVSPTLYQQNKIAQGEFEVVVGYRFLDAQTSVVEGRYDIEQVLSQFIEETQKSTTKRRSSGWQVLGFGSRRSRLKSSLEQNFQSNTEVNQWEGTRVVTYDATDDMIERFEAAFFPALNRQQLIDRHLAAAGQAEASGNAELARIHREYADAIATNDQMKEVDIEKAAAALAAQDYAGFIAHGMRFSSSDHQRTDNFRRVVNTRAEIEQHREWLDYRTRTVQRETSMPVAIEGERQWRAALGLCNAANMTVPIFRPYMPPQPRQVTSLTCIEPEGALRRAGFEPGMWVLEFDGRQVTSAQDIDEVLDGHQPGDDVLITYIDVPNSTPLQTAYGQKWVRLGSRP